jgi:uncharacterized membrane protein YheB (UPF0754 family)
MENVQTMDELVANLISKDAKLMELLKERVRQAIAKLDFNEILVTQMQETIEAVFDSDELFAMLSKAVKSELKNAITAHFGNIKAKKS